jgi:hypothetical protein
MPSIPKSESPETLLVEWMLMSRHRKRLHNEAYKYYKRYADTSILATIILGGTSGILNIGLGAIEPISFVVVNIAKNCLGAASLTSTAIIAASKLLELEKNALEHLEHAGKYSEIHKSIRVELGLLRMNDSAFANNTYFMKAIQHEIDRIEESAPSIPGFVEVKIGA